MSADVNRCPRCGTKFANHGGACNQPQTWWVVPKILHDEARSVTPTIHGDWIRRDEGMSSVAHTRFFAAQLLAAADVLAADLESRN